MNFINNLSQSENSDVEFSHGRVVPMETTYKQRIVDVLLDNPFAINFLMLEKLLNSV